MRVSAALLRNKGIEKLPIVGSEGWYSMIDRLEKSLDRALTRNEKREIIKASNLVNRAHCEHRSRSNANYRGKIQPGISYREMRNLARFK